MTRAAPATKGFRIARAPTQQAAAQTAPGYRPATMRPAPAAAVRAPRVAPRPGVARAVASQAPAGRPRADLMITFELGSDRMTSVGATRAQTFARTLLRPELAAVRFQIEGHTDSSGSAAANRDLSQRRAAAVASYLVAQGVGRDRLEVRGLGSDEPLAGHRASDPSNRRVEAELIS